MNKNVEPLKRFTGRVDNYKKYRPDYSGECVRFLMNEFDLREGEPVADVGSGTGIFSRRLLAAGLRVYAVEPNADMRGVAEADLSFDPGFKSVSAPAEATGLPAASVKLVTAAQAFHWFSVTDARAEFRRILKPEGGVALIWNTRETKSAFGGEYEKFLEQHSIDYPEVRGGGSVVPRLNEFFGGGANYSLQVFPNSQKLDWAGFWGRYQSTSYSPKEGDAKYQPAERRLREIFDKYAKSGVVEMIYDTEVFFGRV